MTPNPQPPAQPDATIVIPQYGQAELTIACLRSLRQRESRAWPVLVVDDGSPDHAAASVRDVLPDVTVIEQPHQGVTRAWNLGTAQVGTPFVVFLNNDTLTTAPWVDCLLAPLRNETARLCGVAWRAERALPPEVAAALPTLRFVEGWCCALSVARLRELGGFDESFHMYFSDTDLQVRLAHRFGRGSLTVVDEVQDALRHRGHASTRMLPQRRAIWTEDRRRFVEKWRGECESGFDIQVSDFRFQI